MKRYIALSSILFLVLLVLAGSVTIIHAQSITPTPIPSDLLLDLQLAEQNPSADEKAIVAQESQKVEEVTTTGQETIAIPQDTVSTSVKTESPSVVMHPDQTSSEQVIEVPITQAVNDSGTPVPSDTPVPPTGVPQDTTSPTVTGVIVPGTTVSQPDDNAAPTDNSANPNLPAPTSADNGISPTPIDTGGMPTSADQSSPTVVPSDTPAQGTTNTNPTIQPTTDLSTQPTVAPTQAIDQTVTAQPTNPPDTSMPQPTSIPATSAPDTSTPQPTSAPAADTVAPSNTPAVQGASIQNVGIMQVFSQTVNMFFHSVRSFITGK